ncbi:tetratricopeptide repeat protein [Hazenella sp. IB182357]|uniref:Tetratricopeptide repeat protein n=1 Tax=Polycladospora coralii TaxID=2771432 RepID=A0A926N9D4_9BACL|nr:tetratricopeptide repeat protein [Polycladospora coralii]MBD1372232.1 tetratricopeptide repeat protein [Polycladospora coralii]MBS7530731.1 tetratricopeptide repeat protein [Polycladospora coralii]
MKKSKTETKPTQKKIVPLQMDAGFYFERAVRSIDRHQYEKAIRYFKLAMEKEPHNAINHCNLAGLLSELGRFEESNEVLETVLAEVNPDLHECLFFLANNSANMGAFELAEDYLLEYLSAEPAGEYMEEAEDMLYMISIELGRPPKEPPSAAMPEYMQSHEIARDHLEAGHFLQAIERLEKIIETNPEFLAAQNNLALAYFYTDRIEDAYKCIQHVLEMDEMNLHALCNLAILSFHNKQGHYSKQLIQTLKKLVPLHTEHAYKLATTMGILREHEVAYHLFTRLLKTDVHAEVGLYHHCAVAAWNTGRLNKAIRYWKIAAELDFISDVPRFYLAQVEKWSQQDTELPLIQYAYQLPFEEEWIRIENKQRDPQNLSHLKDNPLLRSSFFWSLNHGDYNTKLQALQVLWKIQDKEVEQLLRSYILKPNEDEELKKIALLILKHMHVAAPIQMWIEGRITEVGYDSTDSLENKQFEQRVIHALLHNMQDYTLQQQNEAQQLLFTFQHQPDFRDHQVKKIEALAGALEYAIAKKYQLKLTQKEIAQKYGVSTSSITRYVKKLQTLWDKHLT